MLDDYEDGSCNWVWAIIRSALAAPHVLGVSSQTQASMCLIMVISACPKTSLESRK